MHLWALHCVVHTIFAFRACMSYNLWWCTQTYASLNWHKYNYIPYVYIYICWFFSCVHELLNRLSQKCVSKKDLLNCYVIAYCVFHFQLSNVLNLHVAQIGSKRPTWQLAIFSPSFFAHLPFTPPSHIQLFSSVRQKLASFINLVLVKDMWNRFARIEIED